MQKLSSALLTALAAMSLISCNPGSLIDVDPPSGIADPEVVASAAGAQQLANTAVKRFAEVLGGNIPIVGQRTYGENFVTTTGLWSDELLRTGISPEGSSGSRAIDERQMLTNGGDPIIYYRLHNARTSARQAREALALYAPTATAQSSRMLSLEAFTIVWFAEFYCSGIPLTEVPLTTGSNQYTAGFSTQELFERANILFDSAITLAGDSARFVQLAKVGKGRALLGLGRFADAAAAVNGVATDFVYLAELGTAANNFNWIGNKPTLLQVVDNEGTNGLVWSTDPRAGIRTTSTTGAMKVPAKYSVVSDTLNPNTQVLNAPIRAASGVEARLIEAEAALATGNASWLTILNTLRSTCVGSAACAPIPMLTSAALPPLTDPGTQPARVNLLMRERAMWLYLTGHRQGDLRRLVRYYQRPANTLWPVGTYVNAGGFPGIPATPSNGTSYGEEYVAIPPADEQNTNRLYLGCIDMNP